MGSSPGGSPQPDGQDDIVQFGRSRRRPRGLGPLLLASLVAVAVVAVVLRSGPHRHSIPPPPPPVAVSDVGHPILGIRAGWELFGLKRATLVAVQFNRGQITRTALPPPEGGGPVSLVAEPGKVIIRPLDNVPGYLVPDGQPARQLTGALAHGALLLPGPAAGEVWDIGWTQSISLLNAQGRPTRVRLAARSARFPAQSSMADSRWLIVVTGSGRVDAVNPRTGHTQDLGPGLSGLTQIAIQGLER